MPAVRVGARRVRVKRSHLDSFLEQGYTGKQRAVAPETPTIWDGEIPPPVVP